VLAGVGIRDVLGVGCRFWKKRGEGEALQMRTARDENVPRFKPRLKSESKVICERKAVA
jgi:hypothetical protein